jgi:phosphoribosylanthranilate isomerase
MNEIRIQIYGIRTPEDACMVINAGAHHIGVSYGPVKRTPGQVGFEEARAIFDAVPKHAVRVGLTVATEMEEIVEMVTTVRPDVLHLSGEIDPFPPEQVALLRQRVPGRKIMQAIPVMSEKAIWYAKQYESVSDYFLLDTNAEGIVGIGATGLTHDWGLDRKVIQATHVPCIIAGGLTAENVSDAIRATHPWGVDSFSHTNLANPTGAGIKDPLKVQAFVDAVRATRI